MKVGDALAASGVIRIEAEMLLAALYQKDRTWVLAHPEEVLSHAFEDSWNEWIARRKTGEPVAYILGEVEFFGRKFFCDRRGLIPRPSTEGLIDTALETIESQKEVVRSIEKGISAVTKIFRPLEVVRTIVDVGTGSGCIAVTVALERPLWKIIAIDTSKPALELAMKNAAFHGVLERIQFLHGDLLEPLLNLRESFFIISNPPYIPDDRVLDADVQNFEPRTALRGGMMGTELMMRLMSSAREHPYCSGVAIECEENQANIVVSG